MPNTTCTITRHLLPQFYLNMEMSKFFNIWPSNDLGIGCRKILPGKIIQKEGPEDIPSMFEVSLKSIQEKPFWYLWKYAITSLWCLGRGLWIMHLMALCDNKWQSIISKTDARMFMNWNYMCQWYLNNIFIVGKPWWLDNIDQTYSILKCFKVSNWHVLK